MHKKNNVVLLDRRSSSSENIKQSKSSHFEDIAKYRPKKLNKSSSCTVILPLKHEVKLPKPKPAWVENTNNRRPTSSTCRKQPNRMKPDKLFENNKYLLDLENEIHLNSTVKDLRVSRTIPYKTTDYGTEDSNLPEILIESNNILSNLQENGLSTDNEKVTSHGIKYGTTTIVNHESSYCVELEPKPIQQPRVMSIQTTKSLLQTKDDNRQTENITEEGTSNETETCLPDGSDENNKGLIEISTADKAIEMMPVQLEIPETPNISVKDTQKIETPVSYKRKVHSKTNPSITIKMPSYEEPINSKLRRRNVSNLRSTGYKPRGQKSYVSFSNMFTKTSISNSIKSSDRLQVDGNLMIQAESITSRDKYTLTNTRTLLKQEINRNKISSSSRSNKIPLKINLCRRTSSECNDTDEHILKSIEKRSTTSKSVKLESKLKNQNVIRNFENSFQVLSPPKFMISSAALKRNAAPEVPTQVSRASPVPSDIDILPSNILDAPINTHNFHKESSPKVFKNVENIKNLSDLHEDYDDILSIASDLTTTDSTTSFKSNDTDREKRKSSLAKTYPILLTRR